MQVDNGQHLRVTRVREKGRLTQTAGDDLRAVLCEDEGVHQRQVHGASVSPPGCVRHCIHCLAGGLAGALAAAQARCATLGDPR